jgi:hypothetical protein
MNWMIWGGMGVGKDQGWVGVFICFALVEKKHVKNLGVVQTHTDHSNKG